MRRRTAENEATDRSMCFVFPIHGDVKLFQLALQREGISMLWIDGYLSQGKRNSVLRKFEEDDRLGKKTTANVSLVSLGAGVYV